MSTVTIPRSVNDPAYRYKMPALVQKIEGRGINTHTTLVNLKDVAKSLRVPTLYILQFMQYDWGAQSIYKTNKNEVHTSINGIQDAEKVLGSLDKFIEKFVLCAKCRLPELYYTAEEREVLAHCNSCGAKTELDPKHKLTTYIAKNPPQNLSDIKVSAVQQGAEGAAEVRESGEVLELRARLRAEIARGSFDPYDAAAVPLFDTAREYLQAVLPLDADYEFDDSHTELVYKALKRLRLRKQLYDRVPFLLFGFLFSRRIIFEVKARASLFAGVLGRHRMGDYLGHETVLNLAYLLHHTLAGQDMQRQVPTIMMKFFEEKLLSAEFVTGWVEGRHDRFFRSHALYRAESDLRLREDARNFIEHVRDEEEEGSEVSGEEAPARKASRDSIDDI